MTTEQDDDFREWLTARPGQVARRAMQEQLANADMALRAACQKSPDPEVRAAMARREQLQWLVNYLTPKAGNGQ